MAGKMHNGKKEKILLIDHDRGMGERIEKLLTRSGYEVRWVNSAYAAIAAFEGASESPFALVISAYRMPGMNGDDLLEHARFIAPCTQRMMFSDVSEMAALVNAVNRAAIHSCIVIPFKSEQLVTQVLRRCEQFRRIQKRESLKKVTEHQNRQMYEMIINLKKKKAVFEHKINEKKKKIRMFATGRPYCFEPSKEGKYDSDSAVREFKRAADSLKLFLESMGFEITVGLEGEYGIGGGSGTTLEPEEMRLDESDRKLSDDILNLFFRCEILKLIEKEPSEATQNGCSDSDPGKFSESHLSKFSDSDLSKSSESPLNQPSETPLQKYPLSLKKEDTEKLSVEKMHIATRLNDTSKADQERGLSNQTEDRIRYYFDTDHHYSDKAQKGESSDYKGKTDNKPFVLKNALLAERLSLELEAPLFSAGINTRLSDDKLKIFATADGQPHLDIMGTVSVFSEMHIQGDVDHSTRDLNFSGNIIVNGAVKAGVRIKCAGLTVHSVEGAQINLTGDLDVSSGIINSDIVNVQGNVHAQYINNSRVKALGDIVVQKEITDSELFSGGQCINANGLITSSFINARKGVESGRIGTEKSSPSKLEVGTEGIIDMMVADLYERADKKRYQIKELHDELLDFESEEKILRGRIAGAAYIQDRARIELRDIEKQLPRIETSEDIEEVKRLFKSVKNLKSKIKASEKIIIEAFERQDTIAEATLLKQHEIESLDSQIRDIMLKQKAINEFGGRTRPKAEVTVKYQLMSGTIITGSRSRLIVETDHSGCKIEEVLKAHADDGGSKEYGNDGSSKGYVNDGGSKGYVNDGGSRDNKGSDSLYEMVIKSVLK
ncbi:MAG: DUF342 domain-containing protein [Desulfamplus sp.]|nr:DUF342 domain-containing protein [Desulfamplus sp.]